MMEKYIEKWWENYIEDCRICIDRGYFVNFERLNYFFYKKNMKIVINLWEVGYIDKY